MIKLQEDLQLRQEIQQALKNNDGYCPCRIKHTPETKCMCLEFRNQEHGYCHCGLYYKE